MSQRRIGSPAMVLVTVCIAQFMAPFMLTSVGVALPSLGRELGATAMQLGLIEQLYVVSLAMGMLAFGRWGDIVGQRRVLLPGLAVFTALTCSLGFTRSVEMVMIQRFFQGLGACIVGAFGNRVNDDMKEIYEEVAGELGLSESMYLLALIPVGVPAEAPAARPRKPLADIASRNRVGNPL